MGEALRFCPYCGTASPPEYAFCPRCGKTLPPAAAPSQAVPPPPPDWAGPPAAEPRTEADVGSTVWDRPLTEEERAQFDRMKRSPAVTVPRVLGSLFGIMPLFLVFLGFMGTAFPPDSFIPVVIGTSVFAFVAGAASFSIRLPASVALSASSVREARGVAEKGATVRGRYVPVRLGDLDLLVPATLAGMLPEGRLTRLVYVHAPAGRRAPFPGHSKVWLLGIGGTPLKRGRAAYVKTSDEASPGGGA